VILAQSKKQQAYPQDRVLQEGIDRPMIPYLGSLIIFCQHCRFNALQAKSQDRVLQAQELELSTFGNGRADSRSIERSSVELAGICSKNCRFHSD